jgi:pimeloyl-ACP methyl ester carboxylesterase
VILPCDDDAKTSLTSAPTVVWMHAFPFDRRVWRAQVTATRAAGARSIAVDLRGFGEARAMTPPRSIADHADDVVETMRSRGVDRAVIVGLSMGGYVALAIAARHPTTLAGVLLADTKSTGDGDEAKAGRAANIDRARTKGVEAVFEAMLPKVVGARTSDSTIAWLRSIAREQPVESVVAALEAMRDRPDRTNELATIAVPTRVVVGADDKVTPTSDAKAMADRIPVARLVEIAGAGHFTNLDDPATFDATLTDLLRAT